MRQIHCGHLGIGSSLRRARQVVYWFGMTKDLIELVERCSVCQKTQSKPPREPLITKEIPALPWEICASDLFKFQGVDYLLLCDSYSGYFEFEIMKNGSSSTQTIEVLKKWFSVHGIPRIVETNGGPQYTSNEFKKFEKSWNFNRQSSSRHYPRSNGLAERYVEIAKNLLRKCSKDGTDVQLALLNLRNVPRNNDLKSPAERLMSRSTRTTLQTHNSHLRPQVVSNVKSNIKSLRRIQKRYVDRGTRNGPTFHTNDKVKLRIGHRDWIGAKILEITDKPRSYILERQDGKLLRRNSSQIRSTQANIKSATPAVTDIREHPKPVEVDQSPTNQETSDQTVLPQISIPENSSNYYTRSGRMVKPVVRMNL